MLRLQCRSGCAVGAKQVCLSFGPRLKGRLVGGTTALSNTPRILMTSHSRSASHSSHRLAGSFPPHGDSADRLLLSCGCAAPSQWADGDKRRGGPRGARPAWQWCRSLVLPLHWLKLSCMAVANCRKGWKMSLLSGQPLGDTCTPGM